MLFGDNIQDPPFPKDVTGVYKDKDQRRGRSRSQLSDSDSSSVSFSQLANFINSWLVVSPRVCKRFGKYLLILLGLLILSISFSHPIVGFHTGRTRHGTARECVFPDCSLPESRAPELKDTLAGYKHRGEKCDLSSLDLHVPFGPVCQDKNSMLAAMSSGGRIGKDAPYMPRGCDMRWFSTLEVCKVLGRYSQVVLVGDSMLRHVMGALNILVREDIGYGAVTGWNFNEEEKYDICIHNLFEVLLMSLLI